MQINIQSHNIEITKHLRKHSENRINEIFSDLNGKVKMVGVRFLKFRNGHKDTNVICQIHVQAHNLPTLITESKADNVYSAIEQAVRRSKNNVSRKFSKLDTVLRRIKSLNIQKSQSRLLTLTSHNQQFSKELS